MGSKRLTYIETMRGLACLLLVSWHVVGMDASDGLQLAMDHPLHEFGFFFVPLRMPLFAFISGYVFNAWVESLGDVGAKIRTKARRLLLPLVFAGGLHFTLRALAYGDPLTGIWRLFFDLYGHFWFLNATFALMCTMLVVAFLARGRELTAPAICLGAFSIFYLLDWELHPVNWFAITKATYIGPFFFLGQFFRTAHAEKVLHEKGARRNVIIAALLAVIAALYFFRQTGPYEERISSDIQTWQSLILSGAIVALLFSVRWENKWLAMIGPYSFAIFLFHVIFTGGLRVVEQRLFPGESVYAMWALGLFVGITGPIVVQKLLARGPPILETLFLGVRYTPRRARDKAPAAAGDANAPS